MNPPLNNAATKALGEFPERATFRELYDVAIAGQVSTFGYKRKGKRVYVTIVEGEQECRNFLDNVQACGSGRSELQIAVRREVRRQLKKLTPAA